MLSSGDYIERYRIGRYLGSGGMADVFQAENLFGERVAIKLLRRELAVDLNLREQFLLEGRIGNRISHPNVVRVLDLVWHARRPGLVMDFLRGIDLRAALELDAPFGRRDRLRVIDRILAALECVHAHGVVHGDIKPSNIFLHRERQRWTPKLIDFGVAHVRGIATSPLGAHFFVGTPGYASPEQAAGRKTLDQRTDIYAVGVLLHELLGGAIPHMDAEHPAAQLRSICRDDLPPLPPEVPVPLQAVVHTATRKRPEERFQSAREFRVVLRRAAGLEAASAPADAPAACGLLPEAAEGKVARA